MPGHLNVGGTWRPFVPWVNIDGTWRRALMWLNVAGTWKVVAGAPQVTLSPSPATGSGSAPTVNSSVVASVVTGNVGSVTYLWSAVSSGGINMLRPTNGSTQQFQFSSFSGPGQNINGTFRLSVTDTTTGQVGTRDINVNLNT